MRWFTAEEFDADDPGEEQHTFRAPSMKAALRRCWERGWINCEPYEANGQGHPDPDHIRDHCAGRRSWHYPDQPRVDFKLKRDQILRIGGYDLGAEAGGGSHPLYGRINASGELEILGHNPWPRPGDVVSMDDGVMRIERTIQLPARSEEIEIELELSLHTDSDED